MLELTISLFAVSFVTEAAGVVLIFREAREVGRSLAEWQRASVGRRSESASTFILDVSATLDRVIGNPRTRYLAGCLVAVGLLTGAAGNFTSLAL